MLTLYLPEGCRASNIFPLPGGGWIFSTTDRRPATVDPNGKLHFYTKTGAIYLRMEKGKKVEFIHGEYGRGYSYRRLDNYFIDKYGNPTKSEKDGIDNDHHWLPGVHENYFIRSFWTTNETISDTCTTDAVRHKLLIYSCGLQDGGFIILRKRDKKTYVFQTGFPVENATISYDEATVLFTTKNELHMIDNPLYE